MSELKWTNSSLSSLLKCGEAFRRRYLEREYTAPSPRMVRGTVVHKVASAGYLRKMAAQALPSAEEARDLAATEFARAWADGVDISPEDLAEAGSAGAIQGQAKDFAVDLAGYHAVAVAPGITPVGVERRITVKPQDTDLVIEGTIDLIDQRPEGEFIRDLKTAQASPAKTVAERSDQLTMYALIRTAETGTLPAGAVLDYLVRTPARADKKHVVLTTTRDRDDLATLALRINTAVESVGRGSFLPAPADAWYCDAAYCGFFRSCRFVSARRRTAA